MNFNQHLNLKGLHSIFPASNPTWLRYDDQKIKEVPKRVDKKTLGTELHEYAACKIELRAKITNTKSMIDEIVIGIHRKYIAHDKASKDSKRLGRNLIRAVKALSSEKKETLKMYINDGVGFKMTPEVTLCCSDRLYGTADTICFSDNVLHIHDLKTGDAPVDINQLRVYAAYFCVEYRIKPGEITFDLRIYQNGDIIYDDEANAETILPIMDRATHVDKIVRKMDDEED